MKLLSVQIGMPRVIGTPGAPDLMDREWTSGIFKSPVSGPVDVTSTGLVGDGQADLRVHGGVDKAINVYPAEHLEFWQKELRRDFLPGSFGENFTVQGALEANVCIGDMFRIGGILVQVTQPRQPCWKLARRWRIKELAARVEQTGRTGWYFRVLETGHVDPSGEFFLTERAHPQWTVAEANAVMHHRLADWTAAAELAACPALSTSWSTSLRQRVATRSDASSSARRLGGE
jgi:MOSC domain-containing protein YiiM